MDDEALQPVKTAVPKFASFRPKHAIQPSILNSVVASRSDEEVNRVDRRNGLERYRHRITEDGHRSVHRRRHRPGRRDKTHVETVEKGPPEPIIASWDDNRPSFVLDVKGDPGNLTYGTIHRYVVPSYYRSGAGSIIGLAPNNKIDRYNSNEVIIRTSSNRHEESKKRDITLFARADRKGVRKLRVKSDSLSNSPFDANLDFVPLHGALGKKRKREDAGRSSDSSGSSSEGLGHYRSIEGKAKRSDHPYDRDLANASNTSGSDSDNGRSVALDEAVRHKSIALSRRVEADPTDADAWLDLIDHQDALLGLGQKSLRSKITNAERLSTADIKISMYEKAVGHIKDPRRRESIILGMMEEGAKVWETKKVFSKWRDVLEADPSYFALWQKYLDFRQTDFLTFRYEEAQVVYSECLSMLKQARSVSTAKTTSDTTFYELQLYVLLRMTLFMREAGYSEHAVAMWQALLEYTFCRPSVYETIPDRPDVLCDAVRASSLSSFHDFWESEVPRIGEDGAMGWSFYAAKDGEAPQPKQDSTGQMIDEGRVFETWLVCEYKRALSSRCPARTVDDVEEDDPYRVILFSDIKNILELLIDPPSPPGSDVALAAFLTFCHLPPLASSDSNTGCANRWGRDSFVRNDNLPNSDSLLSGWNTREVDHQARSIELQYYLTNYSGTEDVFNCPLPYFASSLDTLFASSSWFSTFSAWGHYNENNSGPLELEWVRRVLQTLINTGIGGDSLAEYYLAFEFKNYPKEVRKTAKHLLKQRSSSLRLYNAYSLIEYRLHNTSNGQKVIVTAINMGKSLEPLARRDTILLWRTWIWELLDSGHTQEALQHLLTLPKGSISEELIETGDSSHVANGTASAAALLRVRRALADGRDQMLSSGFAFHAVLYAECLTLLTYLSESLSITAALSSFYSNISILSSSHLNEPASFEVFHQSRAKLLYHHATHTHSFKPSILRESLAESVGLFPNNTLFLSLYAWNESRFRIDDRVRSIIADVIHEKQEESVISWVFSLWNEMRRGVALGSNVHAVRGTFERAVRSETGKCNAGLWKQYVMWEQSHGEMKRAKGVFWRAVRACPWAKEIYMLAFSHLRGVMPFEELRGVYELMSEKELRVHVSLDDVFEAWDERRAAKLAEHEQQGLLMEPSSDDDT